MNDVVLDSSAVLVYLQNEPGAELVEKVLPGALFCAVNLAEVATKLFDRGLARDAVAASLASVGFEVVDFGEELALMCGQLRPITRTSGLSLGDRACLALAITRRAVAYTTDSAWADVPNVKVRLLRPGRG